MKQDRGDNGGAILEDIEKTNLFDKVDQRNYADIQEKIIWSRRNGK